MSIILETLLHNTDAIIMQGNADELVENIQFDSRKITENSLFVAIKGTTNDGHSHIPQAILMGANVIVVEDEKYANTIVNFEKNSHITFVKTKNSAKILGQLADNFYQNPSKKLKIVAVTGTNGKTTTATLLFKLYKEMGYKVGLLSTVQNHIHDKIIPTNLTTPDSLTIHKLLAKMHTEGCEYCFMEASSHALVQERLAGVHITGAIFSNITHDHLDFHGTFDNYIKAKKLLFDQLSSSSFALVNLDDKNGKIMLQNCNAQTQKTFALHQFSDFKAKILENTLHGLFLEIDQEQVWFRLIGEFNAYNLLSVYATARLLKAEKNTILTALSRITGAEGRFEQFSGKNGNVGIVDYAHTPDALKNVLQTIEQLKKIGERVVTVVGCGGDRDKTKRPIMAKLACEYSDKVILTSDNPRTENPMDILNDMLVGLDSSQKRKCEVIENRKDAILKASEIAEKNDIILVAGKGHETYQEINGVKYPFDDREILKNAIK